jgi:hypothetical protein
MKFRTFLLFLLFLKTSVYASVVSGIVRNEDGEILPFATIYVREMDFGTTTNLEGFYEVELTEGDYTFLVQYLGYSTLTRHVQVKEEDLVVNFRLQPRSMVLPNLTYQAGKEDPAYAIMRRVIARSKYHLYQLESYTTEVYIKGSGR